MTTTEEAPQAERLQTLLEVTLREMGEIQMTHDEDGWKSDVIITLLNSTRLRGRVELDSRYPGAVGLWETVWTSESKFEGVRKFPVPSYSTFDLRGDYGAQIESRTRTPDVTSGNAVIWHQEYATTIPLSSILMVEWAVTEVD